MISILIPIYNIKVIKLVNELIDQCTKTKINFEIICLDDYSNEAIRLHNRPINERFGVNYVELSENIGRSRIRNRLAKLARYEWLLFLDADSRIAYKKFVKNYLDCTSQQGAYVGGTKYNKKLPKNLEKHLHWHYGRKREDMSPKKRNRFPEQYFHSNNFLISRAIALSLPFDDTIKGYGYEDLAYGQALIQAGYKIHHIDNPVVHSGLKKVDLFLGDQKTAVRNLALLFEQKKISSTRLIRMYLRLNKYGFLKLLRPLLQSRHKSLESNLRKKPKRLFLLDLLKLYYFDKYINKAKKNG